MLQALAQADEGVTFTVEQAAMVQNTGSAGQSVIQKGATEAGHLIPLFHGHKNALDFMRAVRWQMGVGQPGAQLTFDQQVDLLVTWLHGNALAFCHKNQHNHSMLVGWLRALETEFSITETGIYAALAKLSFNPQQESLRQFTLYFNKVLDTDAGNLSMDKLWSQYLHCLGWVDLQLMQHVINTQPIDSIQLTALQKAVVGKVEVCVMMAADLKATEELAGGRPTYDAIQGTYVFDSGIGADQVVVQ